jgi:hypothetical protein
VRLKQLLCVTILWTLPAGAARAQVSSDTTRRDSARVGRARPDSIVRDSSRARRDSVARADSTRASRDSTTRRDSTATRDSSARQDSAAVRDSIVVRDSVAVSGDSVAVTRDSVAADTVAVPDTTSLPPPGLINVTQPADRSEKDSLELVKTIRAGLTTRGWPVRTPPAPEGAILPAKRIVAFYGNPLSKRMGILGQIPPDSMLARLDAIAAEWQAADSATPVQPALHLIAVVASADPGKDGKYRLRMDSALIEKVYGWAQSKHALLFLDVQPGLSSVMEELPRLTRFLQRPDVHLGIDPEFNMRNLREPVPPGKEIGSLTSTEINFAIDFLSGLVAEKKLPPKVLVVHRFREPMVRGARNIRLDPRVQVVMHMDGWGVPSIKYGSYRSYIVSEPVQFTGFKLFFRHDTQFGDRLLTPGELLQLRPAPLYIQYQ